MINHVVLFKLKEFETEKDKELVLEEFKSKLLALKQIIDELKYIEVGTHFSTQSPSFDICLISHFNSLDDLEKYKIHPEHLKVVDYVKQVAIDRAAVDYEF
jgi:hypothetical protein